MPDEFDRLLVERIRQGEADAWRDLIATFEGRLLAFIEGRVRDRANAEDIVQESFIGFLTSLPNYNPARSLESYLFSIAAHKLTDHLRRSGRRPTVPLSPGYSSSSDWEPPSPQHGPSSLLRSGERLRMEESAVVLALRELTARWQERGEWQKLQCAELLFVRGWANKDIARRLAITEQQVANYKFDIVSRLRTVIQRQNLPEDLFPELR